MAMSKYMLYEKKFKVTIQSHLEDCIEAIESIDSTVAKINNNSISLSEYTRLQDLIETANQKAKHVEQSACQQVGQIDSECQTLLSKKSKLNDELRDKEIELENLHHRLGTLESEMKGHKNNLVEAKKDLDKAKEEVRASEEQQEHAERNMKICALTMLIPVVGTIPGGIALIWNAVDYDKAVDKENAARNMVSEHETTISDHKRRIEACSREIRKKQDDIGEMNKKLESVNEKLEMTCRAIKELTALQKKVQDCTTYLSELAGKVECMAVMTSGSINLDSLKTIQNDIRGHLQQRRFKTITGEQKKDRSIEYPLNEFWE